MENFNGATLWARQTIESDIFVNKPAIWFKIWFYLVSRVNYKDTSKFQRGSCFINHEEIVKKTSATPDQIRKALAFMRKEKMISTRRSTRGTIINLPSYSKYQDINTYKFNSEARAKARENGLQKHEGSTTIVEESNNINNILAREPEKTERTKIVNSIKLDDLYKKMGLPKKVNVATQWQEEAANAFKYFTDAETKRSSIFKCFKDDRIKARIAFSDCKELGQKSVLYFLKVYNELRK